MSEFENQVNETVEKFVQGEDGKLSLPEGYEVDESVLYTARLEKRRRDTFAEMQKTKSSLKALEVENQEMVKQWESDAIKNLSADEQAELDELKASDPDAWRAKIDETQDKARQRFMDRTTDIKSKAKKETELDRRKRLVEEYNEANPTAILTDDVIENDVPPRITRKLAEGKISFDEFLTEAGEFLNKGKVIDPGQSKEPEPNLGKAGGSSRPENRAVEADIRKGYEKTVF